MRTHGSGGRSARSSPWSELDVRPKRHPLEVQAGSDDVLAQVTRSYLEASSKEGCEVLGWNQMDLPQIREARLATGEIAVPDKPPASASPSTPCASTSKIRS